MSRTRNTLAQSLKKWDTLNNALKPVLSDLPLATKDQADFEAAVSRIRALGFTQDAQTAQVRETVKQRVAEEHTARELYDRLAAHLQAKFGPSSNLLLEFAVKPKRTRRRKPTPVTPTPTPETPAPEVKPKA